MRDPEVFVEDIRFDRSMPRPEAVAGAILEGFDGHYRRFRRVAQEAKANFERGDWLALRAAARERIDYYDQRVLETAERLRRDFDLAALSETEHEALWQAVKSRFVSLLAAHRQPECAETFFNSVCSKILARDYFHNAYVFVRPGVSTEHMDADPPSYRSYYPANGGPRACLRRIVDDFGLAAPWEDLGRDLRRLLSAACRAHDRNEAHTALNRPFHVEPDCQIQVLSSLFYRNKGAYAVGRVINGTRVTPFIVPILRQDNGALYIDALLLRMDRITAVFSYTRAYFFVDMEAPAAYVDFLKSIMPHKPASELYSIVGLQKQGKTLFYRDFLHHLRHSTDRFIIAPGIKGLVMAVFTLPSYPYVFKLIRDVIPYPKQTDRGRVMSKYRLVKTHDRAGRMADNWEYSSVTLPRQRFAHELLQELLNACPAQIEADADRVLIRHLYIERRMKPLNIFLQHATDAEVDRAIFEYGNAIKELAAANIFPGDMLFKNFGVTRLDRVVFYDYDEIEYMVDCNFRTIASEGGGDDVDRNDVFPEYWRPYLMGDPRIRAALLKHHEDLFAPAFWQRCREGILQGRMEDVFPYPAEVRFCRMGERGGRV